MAVKGSGVETAPFCIQWTYWWIFQCYNSSFCVL